MRTWVRSSSKAVRSSKTKRGKRKKRRKRDNMGFLIKIAIMALRQIKVPVKTLNNMIQTADKDGDGYISVGELIYFVMGTRNTIRENRP